MTDGYFILVTANPLSFDDQKLSARDLIDWRLQRGLWPIYENTRHRRDLAPGSSLLFYEASKGKGGGSITYRAQIDKIELRGRSVVEVDHEDFLTPPAKEVLLLTNIRPLARPVKLLGILPTLECRPNNLSKWGGILQGGIKKLSENDHASILNEARER